MAEDKVDATPTKGPKHQSAQGVLAGERPSPELLADSLVTVAPMTPGGPLFVQLKGAGEPVAFGPYENPAIALQDAGKVRRFLTAVILEERQHSPPLDAGVDATALPGRCDAGLPGVAAGEQPEE